MIVVESGWRALRWRATGSSEGLKTGVEASRPADSYDTDGTGEVSKHYPQARSTRPSVSENVRVMGFLPII